MFTASPGPAIVVGLLDLGDRFRLVLNEIDVVRPPEDLPRLPVARALWVPRPSLKVAAEAWLLAGGPHHTSLTSALRRTHIEDFAEMAGVELIAIGEETTAPASRRSCVGTRPTTRWAADRREPIDGMADARRSPSSRAAMRPVVAVIGQRPGRATKEDLRLEEMAGSGADRHLKVRTNAWRISG